MANSDTLPISVDSRRGAVNVLLFSRPGCIFCRMVRERHLEPILAQRPGWLHLGEVSIEGRSELADFAGKPVAEEAFARRYKADFSPTVVFLDRQGRERAERLIGYSEHFFEQYLQTRIAQAQAQAS